MYQRLSRMLNASRLTVLLLSGERLAWRRRSISFRRSDGQFDGGIWCRLGASAIDGRGLVSGLSSHGSQQGRYSTEALGDSVREDEEGR